MVTLGDLHKLIPRTGYSADHGAGFHSTQPDLGMTQGVDDGSGRFGEALASVHTRLHEDPLSGVTSEDLAEDLASFTEKVTMENLGENHGHATFVHPINTQPEDDLSGGNHGELNEKMEGVISGDTIPSLSRAWIIKACFLGYNRYPARTVQGQPRGAKVSPLPSMRGRAPGSQHKCSWAGFSQGGPNLGHQSSSYTACCCWSDTRQRPKKRARAVSVDQISSNHQIIEAATFVGKQKRKAGLMLSDGLGNNTLGVEGEGARNKKSRIA